MQASKPVAVAPVLPNTPAPQAHTNSSKQQRKKQKQKHSQSDQQEEAAKAVAESGFAKDGVVNFPDVEALTSTQAARQGKVSRTRQ